MKPDPPAPRRWRWLRAIALGAGSLVLVLSVLLVVGVPIPLGPLREPITARAESLLGRDVELGGLHLTLGIRPRLRVEDVRIRSEGASGPDLLALEQLELQVDLAPLLRRRVSISRAHVEGVSVHLKGAEPDAPLATPEAAAEPEDRAGLGNLWPVDVDELSIANVEIVIDAEEGEPTHARIEELTGSLAWDEAVELSAHASFNEIPLALELSGASVRELLDGTEAWPLDLVVEVARSRIELSTRLDTAPGSIRLEDLRATSRVGQVNGWLAFERGAVRPRLEGVLGVAEIDLGPTLAALESDDTETPAEPPAPTDESAGPLPEKRAARLEAPTDAGPSAFRTVVELLDDFETDLQVSIDRIVGLGLAIENVSIAAEVTEGTLEFPMAVAVASIPLSGTLGLGQSEGLPHAWFRLGAESFRVGELGAALAPETNLRGEFEALDLELDGRGERLREFLGAMNVSLRAAGASLTYGAEKQVPFGVELLELGIVEAGPLALRIQGQLLGEGVELELSAGGIEALRRGTFPLHLDFAGAGATLALDGEVRASRGSARSSEFELELSGGQLSDLEPWIGALPIRDASYALGARLETDATRATLHLEQVRLGEAKLTGELGREKREAGNFHWANLEIESLDLTPAVEASASAPASEGEPPGQGERTSGASLDAPILPRGIDLADADLSLRIGSLRLREGELEKLRLTGSFRENHMVRSPFGFRLGGADFDGSISADFRDTPHELSFELGAEAVDVGQLLSRLGLVENIDAFAGELLVEFAGQGGNPNELLSSLDLRGQVSDVRWTLGDEDAPLKLELEQGQILSHGADEPVALTASGSVKGIPLELELSVGQRSFVGRPEDEIPLAVRARLAGATLALDSTVALPIGSQLGFEMSLEGERLDGFSPLVGYELPPLGPYRLAANLDAAPGHLELSDLDVRVGQSQLRGSGTLDMSGGRPRLDVQLESPLVQIDDFVSKAPGAESDAADPEPEPALRDDTGESDTPVAFFTAEGLRRMDANFSLEVERVLSGEDELGGGTLVATLEDGRFSVDPLDLDLPGGGFHLDLAYAFVDDGVEARIRALSEHFDFGVLARRIDPETEMGGWLTLDLDIEGRAPSSRELLAHSSGEIDFFAAPENIQAGLLDLWALSLLSFLVPRLDSSPRSQLNCVVARFDLQEGGMAEEALLLDTTTMSVRGNATIDFREETIEAVLVPRPKRPQMLSLQTAVSVNGSFEDFGVGVAPQELVATFVRMAASVVVVPVQRIFTRPLPKDGIETCTSAWHKGRGATPTRGRTSP